MSILTSTIFGAIFVCIASSVYRRYKLIALSDIPGPKQHSIFTGRNTPDLALPDCGVTEREWQEKHGHVVCFRAAFGENRLWIADPKALQRILQGSGHSYKKTDAARVVGSLVTDRGVSWATGNAHKRQRRIMLPAFGMPESRSFMPDFRKAVGSIIDKWNHQFSMTSEKSLVLDIPSWLARATLDAIGTAAFDYNFDAVNDPNNPLTKAYNNLFPAAFGSPSAGAMFWNNLMTSDLPTTFLYFLYEILPVAGIRRLRENRSQVREVARKLYEEKRNYLQGGGEGRDVLSLMIKANASENEKTRLADEEIVPQMRNIILAGHETTSNTTSWILYELAQRPELQARVRAEIMDTTAKAQARGDDNIIPSDFDNMTYTVAVIKESLRLHPIVWNMLRQAVKDDVVPLYTPLTTRSGKIVKEIMIPEGTILSLSVHGYHLNKDVWGPDAYEFNHERWFSPKNQNVPSIGVYGNLLTFSGGYRSCIGWRFAVIEMQTFLISLLTNFEFSIPEGAKTVHMNRSGLMVPMVEGEIERGIQLPLKVTPICSMS